MYKISELKNMLLFDLESLPKPWNELTEEQQSVWKDKHHYRCFQQEVDSRKKKAAIAEDNPDLSSVEVNWKPITFEQIYTKYAGLYAEYSRIWCISFGAFNLKNEIEVNTLRDEDEVELLKGWLKVLNHYSAYNLAGYYINEFDIPFIITRMQILGLNEKYPPQLQLKDAKPWTVKHVDFYNDWKSLRRDGASLATVCAALGVASPKDKFNNDEFTTLMTNGLITEAEGIEYCEKDVVALGKCMLKCATEDNNFGADVAKKVWAKK